MSVEEMEQRSGQTLGYWDKTMHLKDHTGRLTQWHLIGGVFLRDPYGELPSNPNN